MDSLAIQRVSQALKALLKPVGRVFIGPLDDDRADADGVVLFPYRMAANADLRNREHVVPADMPGDPPIVYHGSLPLDVYFLLTVHTKAGVDDESPSLGTLGLAMQLLNASPDLIGKETQGELVRVTLDSVSSEELSRIWTLFPTANYRTSAVYLASPVWIDPQRPPAAGAPVVHETYPTGHTEMSDVS